MRSIWNGAISFGLVSIPIKLVNATESHSISFRQIHADDGGRIRYRKFCELEDREVTQADIGKAYEDADGTIIPITDEDLSHLPIPTAKTIEIVAFVPADRIDPLQMENAYYLAASGAPAAKPYALLREALKRSQKVAIAKFALRGRERLGMLRVVGDAIAMHGLLWPDEVRAPEGVAPDARVTVRDKDLDLADALMDSGNKSDDTNKTQTTDGNDKNSGKTKPTRPLKVERAQEFVAKGEAQHPADVQKTYDGKSSTYWKTSTFIKGPALAPFKPGVGIVYDLGSAQELSKATIGLRYGGDHTSVDLYTADSLTPTSLTEMHKVGTVTTNGSTATVKLAKAVKTQYVLVWLTAVPYSGSDSSAYTGAGYKQAITDVQFTG